MSRTYQEFKDYLVDFLWKKGDQTLIANLDALIRAADNELNRDLRIERRHKSAVVYVDTLRTALPEDYHSMRKVVGYEPNLGEFKYVDPATLQTMRNRGPNDQMAFYSIEDRFIMFAWPLKDTRKTEGPTPPINPQPGDLWYRTTINPGLYTWYEDPTSSQWVQLSADRAASVQSDATSLTVIVDYTCKMPNYKATDQSWVEDEFGDLYTYAVLKQCAPFLREDERLPNWVNLYSTALMSAIEDSEFNQKQGVYAAKPLPRQASVSRRRR